MFVQKYKILSENPHFWEIFEAKLKFRALIISSVVFLSDICSVCGENSIFLSQILFWPTTPLRHFQFLLWFGRVTAFGPIPARHGRPIGGLSLLCSARGDKLLVFAIVTACTKLCTWYIRCRPEHTVTIVDTVQNYYRPTQRRRWQKSRLAESYNFSTERTMSVQNLNCSFSKMGYLGPKFCIFGWKFSENRMIFRQFSRQPKILESPTPSPFPLARRHWACAIDLSKLRNTQCKTS